jgi:hypothetical protein
MFRTTTLLRTALLTGSLLTFASAVGAEPLKVQSDCLNAGRATPQVLYSTIPSQEGSTEVLVAQAPMVNLEACTYSMPMPPAVKGLY